MHFVVFCLNSRRSWEIDFDPKTIGYYWSNDINTFRSEYEFERKLNNFYINLGDERITKEKLTM